jgi:RNA polymerase sigma factor (sigma-70 family)
MKDDVVWAQFKNGSEEAFALLYKQHAKLLYAYGMKLVKNRDLVEDCIHDLFMDLWRRKEFLSETDSIRLYLLKALKRKILRVLSKNKKIEDTAYALSDDYANQVVFSHESMLISDQLTSEQEEKLKHGLDKLSPNQREIIFLRFYARLSYEEIATMLAINYQSVKNLMFRSMKSLRKEFVSLLVGFCFIL